MISLLSQQLLAQLQSSDHFDHPSPPNVHPTRPHELPIRYDGSDWLSYRRSS